MEIGLSKSQTKGLSESPLEYCLGEGTIGLPFFVSDIVADKIVYTIGPVEKYEDSLLLVLASFSKVFKNGKFLPHPNIKEPHGYGLYIPIYRTNLVVLDIDCVNFTVTDIREATFYLVQNSPDVERFDIVQSSPGRHHLYLKLKSICNTTAFYNDNINGFVCNGYATKTIAEHFAVIRISEKFNTDNAYGDNIIKPIEAFVKDNNNTWLKYSSDQLIAPLEIVDGSKENIIPTRINSVLNLRAPFRTQT